MNIIKCKIKYLYLYFKFKNKLRFYSSCVIDTNATFEGCNKIYNKTIFKGKMGFGSYIGPQSYFSGQIGRFSSIASRLRVICGRHSYTYPYATTCPMFFSLKRQNGETFVDKQKFEEFKWAIPETKTDVIIGSDCWIGESVMIVGGCRIADGAVILAGAIVTKDIPPYAIAGGIPAHIIRYRYSNEDIAFLLAHPWWEKNITWIHEHRNSLLDINKLKENLCK